MSAEIVYAKGFETAMVLFCIVVVCFIRKRWFSVGEEKELEICIIFWFVWLLLVALFPAIWLFQ